MKNLQAFFQVRVKGEFTSYCREPVRTVSQAEDMARQLARRLAEWDVRVVVEGDFEFRHVYEPKGNYLHKKDKRWSQWVDKVAVQLHRGSIEGPMGAAELKIEHERAKVWRGQGSGWAKPESLDRKNRVRVVAGGLPSLGKRR